MIDFNIYEFLLKMGLDFITWRYSEELTIEVFRILCQISGALVVHLPRDLAAREEKERGVEAIGRRRRCTVHALGKHLPELADAVDAVRIPASDADDGDLVFRGHGRVVDATHGAALVLLPGEFLRHVLGEASSSR